jgi:hypothetical protein
MGHIKEEDRITAYPISDIHWIGSVKEGGKTWAKGYIPKTAVAQREHYRILMATNGKAATSVYGQALKEFVDHKKGTWRARDFKLEQLDLAPYGRAALKPESGFMITTEMVSDEPNEHEEQTMDKLQIIRELTSEDAALLPPTVRDAVLSAVQPAPEIALVTELRTALGVDEKADLKATIAELKQEQETQRKATVTGRIKELIEDEEKGIKVKEMQGLVTELVTARNPQTIQEAEAAYTAVVESDHVKAALAAHVRETMGPRQTTPLQTQNTRGKYFVIPQEATN